MTRTLTKHEVKGLMLKTKSDIFKSLYLTQWEYIVIDSVINNNITEMFNGGGKA